MLKFKLKMKKAGIARRLITYVVLFSSIITLLTTTIQLYLDYSSDLDLIEEQLQQIENVHLKSLTTTLWASDSKELTIHLEGISQLRDMQFLEIRDQDKVWVSVGARGIGNVISRQFPMIYSHRGRDTEIGNLTVIANLSNVYQRLIDKIWVIFISNGIKTFLVAGFILYLFYTLNTRHLIKISNFARNLDMTNLNKKLILNRSSNGKQEMDELDLVVNAINLMQDNIKKSFTALEQSEGRFQILAEVSPMGIFRTDAQGNNIYVNERFCELAGLSKTEMIGESWSLSLHPQDKERVYTELDRTIAKNIPFNTECRFQQPNGKVTWLLAMAEAERDTGGQVIGYVGAIVDITDRKRAEVELANHREHLEDLVLERTVDLKNARDEAERANAAKSEFLSRMSHELRTPLNAVLGFAQLMELDSEEFNKTQQYNIIEILDAGHHLLNLINDVLDLAAIESGKLEISIREVPIDELLQQCISLIQPQADRRLVKLIDNISNNGYIVQGDFTRLKQVLLNLLVNAVKYNRDHGHVTMESETIDKKRLRIRISDTGEGLTEEEIAKLFTPFERLNTVHNIEGTGIGLVITKHLIERMGGSIGVESTPGKGSTFWVEIPLAKAA